MRKENATEKSRLGRRTRSSIAEPTVSGGSFKRSLEPISKIVVIIVNDICVHTPWISDHSLVAFKLSIQKPAVSCKTVITRDWNSLNLDLLSYEITRADFRHSSNVVSECVCHYDNNLRALLDVHAPSRSRTILMRPRAP